MRYLLIFCDKINLINFSIGSATATTQLLLLLYIIVNRLNYISVIDNDFVNKYLDAVSTMRLFSVLCAMDIE